VYVDYDAVFVAVGYFGGTRKGDGMKPTQIWRFKLGETGETTVEMPEGAEVLCVQWKDDAPCVWAEVDKDAPKEKRWFEVFLTGKDIPFAHRRYVGTFQAGSIMGTLVFHVYERLRHR
jgi:hypothetical protein